MTELLQTFAARHAEAFSSLRAVVPTGLWIDGRCVDSRGERRFEAIDPTTRNSLTSLPVAESLDLDAAVAAARSAFPLWAGLPIDKRAAILTAVADQWQLARDDLVTLSALDSGMPKSNGRTCDVDEAIATYYQAAQNIKHARSVIDGTERLKAHEIRRDGFSVIESRRPYGVVGVIGVWNFVAQMTAWDTAMALATGNCVVFKPSENAPLVPLLMAKLASDAGLPPGVLNVVTGDGRMTGAALAAHPGIDLVGMTGSIGTARRVMHSSADTNLKELRLELGGKSPLIVLPDGDLTQAANTIAELMLLYQAQNCVMCSRIFIAEQHLDRFLSLLQDILQQQFQPGDPLDEAVNFGPLINGPHHERVSGAILTARQQQQDGQGINLAFQLALPPELAGGWFVPPMVFVCRDDRVALSRDETFGPVITVHPYRDAEEAIFRANDTLYGLGAGVFGADIDQVVSVARRLNAGIVYLNGYGAAPAWCHFGGIRMSGFGGNGVVGADSIDTYTSKIAQVAYL